MKNLELLVVEDISRNGIRVCLKPNLPEVLTPSLLTKIRMMQNALVNRYLSSPWEGYFYVIWYSHKNHGSQGRGLDFKFILEAITKHKDSEFENYICTLYDLLFLNYIGLGLPLINCSITDRAISGMSQEFFILNQINFLRKVSSSQDNNSILKVSLQEVARNLVFPESIYKKNQFYTFNAYNFNEMKKLITGVTMSLMEQEKLDEIRLLFDRVKNETIKQIYYIASTKIKVIERLAKIQNL